MKLKQERIKELNELEGRIGYTFKNIELLDFAFHHISKVNESKSDDYKSNERLEFLGDAILGAVFAEYFFKKHRDKDEGKLTKLKSMVTCEDSFNYVADHFKLGQLLILGKGEAKSGGRNRASTLSDTFEALMASIYLDSSYEVVYRLITEKHIGLFMKYLETSSQNYKSILQNYIQREKKEKLTYKLDSSTGPDHDKTFYVTAYSGNRALEQGVGKNKKQAEQDAAKNTIIKLGIDFE
ncbi:ribonuclease III [Lagierella sp.]|uniref:ribonuclease III n=1 Tax=Lagierella sp. TaxID=2849657 RepID=UPI002622E6E0|nr:ribonuclease III [Lagierella sp.]